MELILIWLVCGIVGAMIGAQKKMGCLGFILGILLGPIGILIVVFAGGDRVRCPHCREWVRSDASVCPHCQREVERTE